jgi:peptidoglycan/xylan/chitin deacetylase (PgdA/CDA1 family)
MTIDDVGAVQVGSSVVAVDCLDGPPTVVLTYDDGPQPGGTDAILTALDDSGATATFFVLLSRVRRHDEMLRDVIAAGHEIGLHGPDHRRLTALDPKDVAVRTRVAKDELEDRTGRAVQWFRPPYGSQSAATWQAARDAGLTTVLWSLDCADWLDVPLADRLETLRPVGAGSVVLLHDGYATVIDGVDDGRAPTFDRGELTRSVIEVCTGKGLACVSLGRALDTGRLVERARLMP